MENTGIGGRINAATYKEEKPYISKMASCEKKTKCHVVQGVCILCRKSEVPGMVNYCGKQNKKTETKKETGTILEPALQRAVKEGKVHGELQSLNAQGRISWHHKETFAEMEKRRAKEKRARNKKAKQEKKKTE